MKLKNVLSGRSPKKDINSVYKLCDLVTESVSLDVKKGKTLRIK